MRYNRRDFLKLATIWGVAASKLSLRFPSEDSEDAEEPETDDDRRYYLSDSPYYATDAILIDAICPFCQKKASGFVNREGKDELFCFPCYRSFD